MAYRKTGREYAQWRPSWYTNSKNHQVDFLEWLIYQGADIHTNLKHNELLKFTINGDDGFVWHTGMCCSVFRKWLKIYKSGLNKGSTDYLV